MGFHDVANRVFALYSRQDYEAAVKVVQDARSGLPDRDNNLTFWEACILAKGGQPGNALAALAAGLDRGQWWPSGQPLDRGCEPTLVEQAVPREWAERTREGWTSILQGLAKTVDGGMT